MALIKRGNRKLVVLILGLIYGIGIVLLVWMLFDDNYAAILGVSLGYGQLIIGSYMAVNYGTHKQEIVNLHRAEDDVELL